MNIIAANSHGYNTLGSISAGDFDGRYFAYKQFSPKTPSEEPLGYRIVACWKPTGSDGEYYQGTINGAGGGITDTLDLTLQTDAQIQTRVDALPQEGYFFECDVDEFNSIIAQIFPS